MLTPNFQIPISKELPIPKAQAGVGSAGAKRPALGSWDLELPWKLVVGPWKLTPSEHNPLLDQRASVVDTNFGIAAAAAAAAPPAAPSAAVVVAGDHQHADADAGHDAAGEERGAPGIPAVPARDVGLEAVAVIEDRAEGDEAGAAGEEAEAGPLDGVAVA